MSTGEVASWMLKSADLRIVIIIFRILIRSAIITMAIIIVNFF